MNAATLLPLPVTPSVSPPEPVTPSVPGPRDIVLRATALATAKTWTHHWFRSLADDGRPVDGGWPGTVQEARARVGNDAVRALARSAMVALSHDELGRLARVTNDEARRLWRAAAG